MPAAAEWSPSSMLGPVVGRNAVDLSARLCLRGLREVRWPDTRNGGTMVKLVVLYGLPEDTDAFERHYADTHAALAKAIPGLRRFEAARGTATPDGSGLPYQRIAELTFDD